MCKLNTLIDFHKNKMQQSTGFCNNPNKKQIALRIAICFLRKNRNIIAALVLIFPCGRYRRLPPEVEHYQHGEFGAHIFH